jgi:HD-GYP domain-containing protein (c-di-GMP phosphodiesterase class II)
MCGDLGAADWLPSEWMGTPANLRVLELLASLSLATDLGTGQPMGHGLTTTALATAIARALGCSPDEVRVVQQVALLRFLGCTSDADETAVMAGGDDRAFNAAMSPVINGGNTEALRALVGAVGVGQPLVRRARLLVWALDPGATSRSLAGHCEVASMLSVRLGLGEAVGQALTHGYERWDGKGFPRRLGGLETPLPIRIAMVARDIDLCVRAGHPPGDLLAARRGHAYDPAVVDAAAGIDHRSDTDWDDLLAAEPRPYAMVDDLDRALGALADFVDLKSPWLRGHSPRVADLAATAGRVAGIDDAGCRDLWRAGMVHDLGRVGVANGVWDHPGPLSTGDREQVRLHPYHTQRILARCDALASIAELAACHHERLDGSGYPRQAGGDALPDPARLLAAADVAAALTAERPHRPAFGAAEAVGILDREVAAGRLDERAVAAVVTALGGEARRVANPGGLSDRELEVLRLLAVGFTNRRVGEQLFISHKTVGRHVENLYAKLGVSTRAGATVWAMEHRLLDQGPPGNDGR